jgi:mRNA-binding protein PUF3
MDTDFDRRFGRLGDLVQGRSKVVEEILAELKRSGLAKCQGLILWLAPFSAELSLTNSGTLLVQEAIDLAQCSSSICWKSLLETLLPRAVELSRSRHGNFALQRLVHWMNKTEALRLVNVLSGHVQEVVQQAYGCRTFERLLEHFSDPELTPILDELVANALEFAMHKHANYAISAIIEHGTPERRRQVIDALVPAASALAMNRVATHVLERALRDGEEVHKQKVQSLFVSSWLSCSSPSVEEVASSKFGSFLLADFAQMTSEGDRAQVRSALAPSLLHLQASEEGRRIVAAYGLSQ